MITDAFRLHFLKYNKEWLIQNLRSICGKKQFLKYDFYLLKLYSDLGDIQQLQEKKLYRFKMQQDKLRDEGIDVKGVIERVFHDCLKIIFIA